MLVAILSKMDGGGKLKTSLICDASPERKKHMHIIRTYVRSTYFGKKQLCLEEKIKTAA